jgi:putative Holliday junction resolvase
MRILGIDPGTKRCGVAVTDSRETMAFPREPVDFGEDFLGAISRLVAEEEVALVVIGRPLSLAGRATQSTVFADELFAQLQAALEVTVVQHDERLTTTTAHRALSDAGVTTRDHRGRVDSAAAVVMLQHFADARHAH